MRTYLKDCKRGRFLLLQGDMVSQYADIYGEWCEQELRLFESIVLAESNVVEIGSHIGLHAVPLAKMAGKGKLFCFEPQRILYQILCANCALNNCLNVYAFNRAIGNHSGQIQIASTDYVTRWNYGSFSIDQGFSTEGTFQGTQSMETIQINKLDEDPLIKALDAIRLLKIDVEGLEIDVIRGSRKTIEKHQPVLFVENNKEDRGEELIAAIRKIGYECFWYCAERFRPENYNQVSWKVPGVDVNMVCFPQRESTNVSGLCKVNEFADLKKGNVPLIR